MHVFETRRQGAPARPQRGRNGLDRGRRPQRHDRRLEALRDDEATREAIERATIEQNGSEVVVEIGSGGKGFGIGPAWITFGRTPQVGVEIRCPSGSDLDARDCVRRSHRERTPR